MSLPLPPQKRSAPSAHRNRIVIGEHLTEVLPDNAKVLEIASGTGEHGAWFTHLRPDILWKYSDIDPVAMDSQTAYALENPKALRLPIKLNVADADWQATLAPVNAVYCANMIHIAPWAAAEGLADGAGRLLPETGLLVLYGPFLRGGKSAPSNLDFDANLRHRNAAWGVREFDDVVSLMEGCRLELKADISMPRDNSLLVFHKV